MRRKDHTSSPSAENHGADASSHLASIEKLLAAAFDLMKQQPAIDPAAFEQLRQLRVRLRYAAKSAPARGEAATPAIARALYEERPDKNEGPLAFTARVYATWLGKAISRADIKRLDIKLYNALYNLDHPSDELDRIGLFTAKTLNDMKLEGLGGLKRPPRTLRLSDMSPEERERARLFNLARRRRQRSAKS